MTRVLYTGSGVTAVQGSAGEITIDTAPKEAPLEDRIRDLRDRRWIALSRCAYWLSIVQLFWLIGHSVQASLAAGVLLVDGVLAVQITRAIQRARADAAAETLRGLDG